MKELDDGSSPVCFILLANTVEYDLQGNFLTHVCMSLLISTLLLFVSCPHSVICMVIRREHERLYCDVVQQLCHILYRLDVVAIWNAYLTFLAIAVSIRPKFLLITRYLFKM